MFTCGYTGHAIMFDKFGESNDKHSFLNVVWLGGFQTALMFYNHFDLKFILMCYMSVYRIFLFVPVISYVYGSVLRKDLYFKKAH